MLKITQTNQTNIALNGYVFPVGTEFTGYLTITEDGAKGGNAFLNTSYKWYIDDATEPTNGLNLPYGTSILIDGTNELFFNEALGINTQLNVIFINSNYAELEGQIQIII